MTAVDRWTRSNPCPICGGHDGNRRGMGERCWGFLSSDSEYAHCTRKEFAGSIALNAKSDTYPHRLRGKCHCGTTHGADTTPLRKAVRTKGRNNKRPTIYATTGEVADFWRRQHYEVVAEYIYTDEQGEPVRQVLRLEGGEGKTFRQASHGEGGWVMQAADARPVLYRLLEVIAAVKAGDTVYIAEGEKDVEALRAYDLVATCNPGGAGRDITPYLEYLRDADVVVIPDLDEPGRKHARKWTAGLRGIAKSCEVREPTVGKDAYDALVTHGLTLPEAFAVASIGAEAETQEWKRWPILWLGDANGERGADYIVDDLIHAGTMGGVYGPFATLKTMILLDLAAHLGRGIDWFGLKTRKRSTVFVAAEGGGGIEKRLAALRLEHPELPAKSIAVLRSPVNLLDECEVQEFTAQLIELLPALSDSLGLVVFDTFSQSIASGDENAASDFTRAERNVRELLARVAEAQTDAMPAACLVHHTGKDSGRGWRGSSAGTGNLDWLLECVRTDADTTGELKPMEDGVFALRVQKVKDGPAGVVFPYSGTLVEVGVREEDGKRIVAPVVRPASWEVYSAAAKSGKPWRPTGWAAAAERAMEELRAADGPRYVPEVIAESGYRENAASPPPVGEVEGHPSSDLETQTVSVYLQKHPLSDSSQDPSKGTSPKGVGQVGQPDRTKEHNRRRSAQRGIETLQERGIVLIYNGWVWRVVQ